MARTLQTEPRALLAARRVARPRASRAEDAVAARLDLADAARKQTRAAPATVRITCAVPRPGFVHPASRVDIKAVLAAAGAESTYGLRCVELCRASIDRPLRFARLMVPGRIRLYEQPEPPWRLRGSLRGNAADRLRAAGARVHHDASVDATVVEWPGDALRRFMLLDVLLHELGHHVLQHHKGKRFATIARTRDHEAFADRHAWRLRERCAAALGADA